jgi:glutamate racemase
MDIRPIGVFDSGLGGLTALRELSRLLPHEELVYFGDTGRVPYGGRSRETIVKYARQDVAFLRTFDLKAIVIACGTVSTTAMSTIAAENPLPVLGVVEPAAEAAVAATKTGSIGLIGTRASIRTSAYETAIRSIRPDARILAAACPLLVPLVENGRHRPGDIVVETVTAEYLAPFREAGVDTLVLGCTHYPLLKEIISAYMGPQVTLIDTGAECARRMVRLLKETDALAPEEKSGNCHYYVSDSAEDFSELAAVFLGQSAVGSVAQIDITRY